MSDFTVVDPHSGWEYDLQSIYSAYIGHFQLHGIPWYERSWGNLFRSFEEFLTQSWPVIVVTDAWTGRAHIVTQLRCVHSLIKEVKNRYKETLPIPANILQISPFESSSRPLRTVSDYTTYRKLHATLPAASLSAYKARVKAGEPKAVRELWEKRDKTFLAVDFEWSERNENSCLEWGYAAMRCGHLVAQGHWPPQPDKNYRKGHYIISEYVDKVHNKHCPTHPWKYAFGDSQLASKNKLPQIIEAVISSMVTPDSETVANGLVLVAHGASGDLKRLEEMKIKIPHNMLIVDTSIFERALFSAGERPPMLDPKTHRARAPGSTLSLENLLISFTLPSPPPEPITERKIRHKQIALPDVMLHNAGNDAFLCLFAMQMLLDPEGTAVPTAVKKTHRGGGGGGGRGMMQVPMPMVPTMGQMVMMTGSGTPTPGLGAGPGPGAQNRMSMSMGPFLPGHHGNRGKERERTRSAGNLFLNGGAGNRGSVAFPRGSSSGDLAAEFGGMGMEQKKSPLGEGAGDGKPRSRSPGPGRALWNENEGTDAKGRSAEKRFSTLPSGFRR